MNVLSMYALIGAYSEEGEEWLEELREVLDENINYAYEFISTHWTGVSLAEPEGTYMLYLDCGEWCREHGKTIEEVYHEGLRYGVIWQDGRPFNSPDKILKNLAIL